MASSVFFIDHDRVSLLANLIRNLHFQTDPFTDPRLYPPESADLELQRSYFFFVTAIDHRTHLIGEPRFEAELDGEHFSGALLLWRLARRKWDEDPRFFTASYLAHISDQEVADWLTVTTPSGARVTARKPWIRAQLLRDAASVLLADYEGCVSALLSQSQGFVQLLLRLLGKFAAYADPVRKKAHLLLKFLTRRRLFSVRDPQNLSVPVDNVLSRLALRTGVVRVTDPELTYLLQHHLPFPRNADIELRETVRRAWNLVAHQAEILPTDLDDLLWGLGDCCERTTQHCTSCPRTRCYPRTYLRIQCPGYCPLASVCAGAQDLMLRSVREQNVDTYFY